MELQFCPNFSALAIDAKISGSKRMFARLRCKQWTCEYCAEKNRQIWRAKLIHHINTVKGSWCWFTLTAHGKKRGQEASIANLRGGWDKLYHRMRYKFGDFSYARIYEKHQDGSYHIHAIASFAFDDIRIRQSKDGTNTTYSTWLAAQAKSLKMGYYTHAANIADEFREHSGYIASYITKYIVKLTQDTKKDFGRVRHIQVSQNWTKKETEVSGEWQSKSGIYYEDIVDLDEGNSYYDLNTNHTVSLDDFSDTYVYPPEFDHRENRNGK